MERTPHGIEVRGIVPDQAQRQQLSEQLSQLPHVSAQVRTFQELESQPEPENQPGRITVATTGATPSPLDTLLSGRGTSDQSAAELSHQFFESSSEIERSSLALADLEHRFGVSALTSEGERLLQTLEERERSRLKSGIASEKQALAQTLRESGIDWPPPHDLEHASRSRAQEAHANAGLCRELVAQGGASSRPAVDILKDITASIASLQRTVNDNQPPAASANSVLSPDIGAHK